MRTSGGEQNSSDDKASCGVAYGCRDGVAASLGTMGMVTPLLHVLLGDYRHGCAYFGQYCRAGMKPFAPYS